MLGLALKAALSPLLVAQAMLARARIPRLPEPEGRREGCVGEGVLQRLLVLGDSSAAGVGVAHQRDALAQPLARELATLARCRVQWRLVAAAGLTTHALLERVCAELHETWDLALVVSGVNDVVDQVPTRRAVASREALSNRLRNAHGLRHIAFMPLPPIGRFVGLAQPLRGIAGVDARRHDRALAGWARARTDVSCVPLCLSLDAGALADDGFHPSAAAYRQIASETASHLAAWIECAGRGERAAPRR